MSRFLSPFFLLLPFFAYTAISTPLAPLRFTSTHLINTRQEPSFPSTPPCGFQGDSDTYGLGIRLGVYINWFTYALFLKTTSPSASSVRGLRDLANSFQLAMTIALVFVTVKRGSDIYAIEAYIILTFCLANALYEGFPPKGRAGIRSFGGLQLTVLYCTNYGLFGYMAWFFWRGMDTMRWDEYTGHAFLFAKVELFGKFRMFMKVISLVTVVCYTVVFVVFVGCKIRALFQVNAHGSGGEPSAIYKSWKGLHFVWNRQSRNPRQTASTPHAESSMPVESTPRLPKRILLFIGRYLSCILRVVPVAAIECMIQWNHIRGLQTLSSTGQLLPLVIAIFGLITYLYTTYGKRRGLEDDDNGERAPSFEIKGDHDNNSGPRNRDKIRAEGRVERS